MHDLNIESIKLETIKIIDETEKIISELIENRQLIDEDGGNEKKAILSPSNLRKDKQVLLNEKQKLDNVEYVVAVVGTMKAGKSMTINAIIGQEVLPSREFPMTTLPTLITHTPGQEVPLLKLRNTEPFKKLIEDIKSNPNTSSISNLSDISDLLNKINSNEIDIKDVYRGQAEIEGFLKQLNDLMRIAKDIGIEPPYDSFTNVDELPRIEVEFYHLSKAENDNGAKLTLLDTPGPDEFKQSEVLKEIFKRQLQRASAVMLLVDYTKMNSQSDAEVKKQVKDVAGLIGKQHLFVLVNKFDQRKRSEDVYEKIREVKKLISQDILKDQIKDENIYPISAKSAFYANFGLRELDKNGKIDTSLDWIDDFGVTLMGEDWEDDIEDTARVRKKCSRTWEKSLFEEPLKNIISTIHSDALFLSMDSQLNKLENMLRQYDNALKTRKSAYLTKLSDLKKTIDELKNDIKKLEEISKDILTYSVNLINDTKKIIENDMNNLKVRVESELESQIIEQDKIKEKEKLKLDNEVHIGGKKLWDGGLFDIFKNSSSDKEKEFKEKGKVEFDNKESADRFVKKINDNTLEYLINASENIEKEVNDKISSLSDKIDNKIKYNFKTILQEIEKKLLEKGDDSLVIELPEISIQHNKFDNVSFDSLVKHGKKNVKKVGDSVWHKIAHWFSKDWGLVTKQKDVFIIEQSMLMNQLANVVDSFIEEEKNKINEEFSSKIQEPLNKKLNLLIYEIEGYRAEQIEVMKQKETLDKTLIENNLNDVKKYEKKIKKLSDRISLSKNILGEYNGQ